MQKVFESCYALDKRCYEAYGLSEDILMEHAAAGMANYIRTHFAQGVSVLIAAGFGNNGADGIALARQLHSEYDVRLYLPFELRSAMAKVQYERAMLVGVKTIDEISHAEVVVDALFGAGLNRNLDHDTEHILHQLNALKAHKIACDIPTGVGEKGTLMPMAFHADVTVTMGAYKEALFLDACKDVVGEILRVDLGVSSSLYEAEAQSWL
ncbi:MAG TPA: NAD(P)H-hydrate epimerase, partial [Sulfurovum sp.]|nr:NAD(P)H-hydrate epimerase [Sulfurovum sp.]